MTVKKLPREPTDKQLEGLLTKEEIMERLGISRATFYIWKKDGKIPEPAHPIGLWKPSQLEDL